MAYKNQNYMTNKKIKAAVDQNVAEWKEAKEPKEEIKMGNLSVTVQNDLEENISGAKVTLTDKDDNKYTGTTGSAGGCNIKNIPEGDYTALAEADTYVSVTENINIKEGDNTLTMIFTEQEFSGSGDGFEEEVDDNF